MKFSFCNDIEISVVELSVADELLSGNFDLDILFLDILLNDGINGIDVGRQIRGNGYTGIIVITTSMEQYFLDGYLIEAFRYIVKPIAQEKVDEALRSVLQKYSKNDLKIEVRCLNGVFFLDLDEIIMIESYHRIRKIYLEGRIVETREALSELYDKLPKDQFVYAQKSFIVNFKHLMSESRNVVTMRNGEKITISRSRLDEFMTTLKQFIKSLGGHP